MSCVQSWPEPIVRVQSLSESGIRTIPDRYIKHLSDRPLFTGNSPAVNKVNIPTIDLNNLFAGDGAVRRETCELISGACREWGFFQVINHGVDLKLMGDMQEAWREFFHLPLEEKQRYANSPTTYEGYGSRLGVVKEAKLDWSDYFFLHFLPEPLKDPSKWPRLPVSCRELVAKYGEEVVELCEKLTRILSVSLGLKEDTLHQAFGGDENRGACLRVNFYPKCPQPDLTLGISPHSDPGGMTLLLPDADVAGLQVRHAGQWVTVKPVPNAFIVNMGDQMQVLTNGMYKSVEHRVIVNSGKERVSLALFYNPGGETVVKPLEELVTEERPAIYPAMTFNQYRSFIRTRGPCGKSQVESLKSPR